MFPKVLVAADFSRHADRTFECIGEIPRMEYILLVHVMDVGETAAASHGSSSPKEVAQALLDGKKDYLEKIIGVPVRTFLIEGVDGDVAGPISRIAKEENVSLIIMGDHKKGFLHSLFSSSVTEDVIRRSRIDLLAMYFWGIEDPHSGLNEKFCRNIFSHVLCAVDFSKPSENTIRYLDSMKFVRRVTLLHVVDPKSRDSGTEKDSAVNLLEDAGESFSSHKSMVTTRIATGDAVQEILRVAEEDDVSLIMLARFGRSDYMKNIPLGHVAAGVYLKTGRPVFITSPHISLNVTAREITHGEYPLAETVWLDYHQQKADPAADRVFGAFVEGTLAALARCKRHPDGLEVDAVFVPGEFRGMGYARKAVQALVTACGNEPLFMHSTLDLIEFYGGFGFRKIAEAELPRTIRDRFVFAEGDMKSIQVQPMRRDPEQVTS